MKAQSLKFGTYEFYFPTLDTLLLVENTRETVVVRATKETFSDRRKEYFIRELSMEGFIPDEYRWFCWDGLGVRWILDRSWLETTAAQAAETHRWMRRAFASTCLLWCALMISLFTHVF